MFTLLFTKRLTKTMVTALILYTAAPTMAMQKTHSEPEQNVGTGAASSECQVSFDPRNYHASINRYGIPGDTDIHTSLQAMFYGVKRVCWEIDEDILKKITPAEWEQMRQHNITYCLSETTLAPDAPCHHVFLYTENGKDRALLLKEIAEQENILMALDDELEQAIDKKQKEKFKMTMKKIRTSFPVGNAYLTGKILDYPEDDIQYFYEYTECFPKDATAIKMFEKEKRAAEKFAATREITL
jgi:hypothetical protein